MEDVRKWRQKAAIYRLLAEFYAGDLSAGQEAAVRIGALLGISNLQYKAGDAT